jgi:PAS domain S-box-containing protein
MYIYWGAELACFYNDAYRQSIGHERHPGSLGQPARDVWDEIWPIIGPQIEQVMSGRGATWHENHLVPITRHGRLDNVYWTYSYSPIDDDTAANGVGGVLVVCTETTAIVSARAQADAERERMARLFDQAPNFMVMLEGAQHRIVLANASYLRLIGQTNIIGKTIDEVLPEAAVQGYLERLDEVFRTGKAFNARGAKFTFAKSPEQEEKDRYLNFIYQPVVDAAGDVTGIFVEGSDVTEQKNAERALKELKVNSVCSSNNARAS